MRKRASTPTPGNILAFPSVSKALPRFSTSDLRTIMDASPQLEQVFGLSISLNDADELGQFVAFCRRDERISTWCLARKNAVLVLWESKTGVDLATHATMEDMLGYLTQIAAPKQAQGPILLRTDDAVVTAEIICLQAARARRRGPAIAAQSKAS